MKGAHTLGNAKPVAISGALNQSDFCTLREGDADDNNAVNIADFSNLAGAFGSVSGDPDLPPYDERVDFNQSGQVNIRDFSLLAQHFGAFGDATCTSGTWQSEHYHGPGVPQSSTFMAKS